MKKLLLAFVSLSLGIFTFGNITFGISESQVPIFGESIGKALIKKIEKKEMKFDKAWGLIEYGVKYYTKDLQKPMPKKDSKNNLKAFCLIYEILRDYNPSVDDTMGSYCGSNNGSNKATTKGDNEDNQNIDSSVREKINQQKQEALKKSRTGTWMRIDENGKKTIGGNYTEEPSETNCYLTPELEAIGYHSYIVIPDGWDVVDISRDNTTVTDQKTVCIIEISTGRTENYKKYRLQFLKENPKNYERIRSMFDLFIKGYENHGYSKERAEEQAFNDFRLFSQYVVRGDSERTLEGYVRFVYRYSITYGKNHYAFGTWYDRQGVCQGTTNLASLFLDLAGFSPTDDYTIIDYGDTDHETLFIKQSEREFDSTAVSWYNIRGLGAVGCRQDNCTFGPDGKRINSSSSDGDFAVKERVRKGSDGYYFYREWNFKDDYYRDMDEFIDWNSVGEYDNAEEISQNHKKYIENRTEKNFDGDAISRDDLYNMES